MYRKRRAAQPTDQHVGARDAETRPSSGAQSGSGRAERCEHAGVEGEPEPDQGDEANPERERDEGDELGDLARGKPIGRIQPVAHRAAREQTKAETMTERDTDERGKRDLGVPQIVAKIAEREKIVPDQRDVAEDGESRGPKQGRGRNRAKLGDDVAKVVPGELPMEDPERRRKEQHGDQRSTVTDKPVRHHSRPSLPLISDPYPQTSSCNPDPLGTSGGGRPVVRHHRPRSL